MHRFYLPAGRINGPEVVLDQREAHHAADVLRLRRADRITVLDGEGRQLLCEVSEVHRREVRARILEDVVWPGPPCAITLFQALPKGKIIETVLQKATELGVSRVVPFLSERVVPHLDGDSASIKAEKWRMVAVEAIKQCGAPWLPRVEAPLPLRDLLARKEVFDLPLIASLQPGSRHPREYFQAFRATHGHPPRSMCFWIGPEGDFTPAEVSAIQSTGAHPITLGPLVMRTDTAALYCLAVANYEVSSPK